MALIQPDKALCVLEFAKTELWTIIQHAFRRKYGKEPPERKPIVRWHGKFITNGCCALSKKALYGPFFFKRATVNCEWYFGLLGDCSMDNLREKESGVVILQQDGVPPHWNLWVRIFWTQHCETDELDGLGRTNTNSYPNRPDVLISHHAISFVGICERIGLCTLHSKRRG